MARHEGLTLRQRFDSDGIPNSVVGAVFVILWLIGAGIGLYLTYT